MRTSRLHFLVLIALFLFALSVTTVFTGQAQSGGWPAPTYDESSAAAAKLQLNDILSRPEYQWDTEPTVNEPSLWERIRNRLLDFLFQLLPDDAGTANAIIYAIAVIGAVLLAVVLIFIVRSFLRNFAAGSVVETPLDDAENLTALAARQQADHLATTGDYRSAVRYLYLSALLSLDEHGLLRYDRSRTNREYLSSISGRPVLADSLRQVVDIFDAVWYGYKPLDAATYAAYEAQVKHLRGLV